MLTLVILIIGVVAGYLLGSISSAILVCKLLRLPSPLTHGSHNPGTTNVLRIGGRFAALLTLVGDVLKGWLPVFLVKLSLSTPNPWVLSAVMLAPVLGHLFPVFFQFKGGKGVATVIGALFGLSLTLGGIFIFTWLGLFALFRISSLSALIAVISMPAWGFAILGGQFVPGLMVLSLLVLWRHKENIIRLCHGQEGKTQLKRVDKPGA